jgi:hypothetical protein
MINYFSAVCCIKNIILDKLTIVEFKIKKKRPVRQPGPAVAHLAPWYDMPRPACGAFAGG